VSRLSNMNKWFRKHDPRNQKPKDSPADPNDLFGFKNGRPVAILRPRDVALKMKTADRAVGLTKEKADAIWNEALSEQDHEFVGYLGKDGGILDKWGRKVDELRIGDSMVGCGQGTPLEPPAFMMGGKFHQEVWHGRKVFVLPNPELTHDSNTGIVMESPDPAERGAIVTRNGVSEVDCHIPSLNRIITGDPDIHYLNAARYVGKQASNG